MSSGSETPNKGQQENGQAPKAPQRAAPKTPAKPRTARKPRKPATSRSNSAVTKAVKSSPSSRPASKTKPVSAQQSAAKAEATDSVFVDEKVAKASGPHVGPPEWSNRIALSLLGVVKRFGTTTAVAGIDLAVRQGGFYGIVGPNGAGKTTTLSMITGLLRPDEGTILVNNHDVWADPIAAKRIIGVLPDKLRLFDRLTGRQLMHYSGSLRGLDNKTVRERSADLAEAFGLEDALGRLVSDYSAGMTKKIALAASMIHSPRLLILDEPFESVDPVSADTVTEILQKYVAAGGTVVLSSHSMDMIERVCDGVAVIVHGKVLAHGTIDEVRRDGSLEDRFIELAGGYKAAEGMEWLLSSLD